MLKNIRIKNLALLEEVTLEFESGFTAVNIASLGDSRSDRLEELARMLGDRKSASARAHAEELLG